MAGDKDYADTQDRMESLALKGKTGGGGRRGGRGGGGAGGDQKTRDFHISKALSMLLRHKAEEAGVELDGEGFARLDKVLQWSRLKSLKPTFAEIKSAVADNAKQRFSMKPTPGSEDPDSTNPADWLIRANQGHSIKLDSEGLHTPITLEAGNIPDVVVHGTYFAFWPKIVESGGLKKMGRTHVHFGTGLPEDGKDGGNGTNGQVHDAGDEATAEDGKENGKPKVISGMRSDAEVLVFIDVAQSLEDSDMKWWLSSNGVVLTEGNEEGLVPMKYVKEARGRRQGVGLLWKDGEKVADLLPSVVARVPMGKRGGNGGRGSRGGRRSGGRNAA
ncbi:putative KptA family-domain-containing protein [Seiridium cardinale]|uniref:2'-phosphotransferase n=1 Tax=Seiridium cardinale TaxID=138064 RepID=A0ABR2Y0M0_9PEZI